jgi:Flp pilus assembly protein TadG
MVVHGREQQGAVSIHILVILVPVILGLMGFAYDLGRMYLIRGELQAAANSMAVAAAGKLIGTEASTAAATTNAQLTIDQASGFGNKFDFGSILIGQTNGFQNSTASEPAYYASAADAISANDAGSGVAGSAAKYARVVVTGDAPTIFWSFLPLATEHKTTIAVQAVAGISTPLCVACGIDGIAVAAINTGDTTDFGFIPATRYSFAYICNGAPTPTVLPGATQTVQYLLLNRYNTDATALADEQTQLFRVGAGGLPGSTTTSQACFTINNTEQIWASAAPAACSAAVPPNSVSSYLCGLTTRFDSALPAGCSNIADSDTLNSAFTPDSDPADYDDYTAYTGPGRRVMTIPIIDALAPTGSMTVLGFRQFLIEPTMGSVNISNTSSDRWGRFVGLYLGSVMPVAQGSFGGCQQTAGPGKVVLHQ